MAGRFSVKAIFKAIDHITAPVTKMQRKVARFVRASEKGFRKLNAAANTLTRTIKGAAVATVAAAALIVGASANVLGAGADFEQAITNVGAVSLKTRKQVAALEKQALSLGRTTKFTATQAAQAMEVMARAGFTSQEILKAVPAVLDAAAASGLEIAEVANHVSNALKGMGLEVSKAAEVADVLALASSRTNSSIGSLGESIKNVASTARQLKIPFNEVVASVALLQDVGLDASVAGTAFNVMLTKMASPSTKVAKIMRRLGLSFKDAKGDMLPLQKVLQQLNTASKKVGGNFDQVAFLAELVGLRGQKAASNLAKLFETDKLAKLSEELKNAEGTARKMANLRMDTVRGSMLLLGSAVDAVKVKIFGLNNGPLKDVIDRMTAWVGANEALIATNIGEFFNKIFTNIDKIVRTARQVAGVITLFIALSVALKVAAGVALLFNAAGIAMAIVLGTMKIAIAAFTFIVAAVPKAFALARAAILLFNLALFANPIGLVIASVVALIAIGAALILAWNPVKEFFVGLWDDIGSIIDRVVSAAKIFGTTFGDTFGFTDDTDVADADKSGGAAGARPLPQVISPQERTARAIEEQRTTSTAEVTIRTGEGTTAEVTGGKLGPGLSLQETGAF